MLFKKQADDLYSKLEQEETEGKLIYYKKRRVYPVINKNGSVNWFNFLTGGTYWNLTKTILFIIIALGAIWEYHLNFKECTEVMSKYNAEQNLTIDLSNLSPEQEMLKLNPNITKYFDAKNISFEDG